MISTLADNGAILACQVIFTSISTIAGLTPLLLERSLQAQPDPTGGQYRLPSHRRYSGGPVSGACGLLHPG
jgi:hypothetical protein